MEATLGLNQSVMYNSLLIHTILSNKNLIGGNVIEIGINKWNKKNNQVSSAYDCPIVDSKERLWEVAGADKYIQVDPSTIPDDKFDVVVMAGCSERFYNQHAIFSKLHSICNKGGLLIYHLSIDSMYGFFQYTPHFVLSLVNSNNYQIEYFAISDRDLRFCQNIDIRGTEPFEYDWTKYLQKYKNIEAKMAVVLTKTSDDSFVSLREGYE